MIDMSNYNVYQNKDGRYRAYNKTTHKVTSYPRVLMEAILGRPLLPTEDVHHKDEDYTNNDPNNLEVIDHRKHDSMHGGKNKKYHDTIKKCPVCSKLFVWTARQQSSFYSHNKTGNGPFCSKRCSGIFGASIQHQGNRLTEPDERICPICGKQFIQSKTSKSRYKNNMNKFPEPVCSSACRFAYKKLFDKKTHIA